MPGKAADEADGPRYVAGSVGPLNVTLSLSPKVEDPPYRAVTFDQVDAAYAEQIAALREGGVDLLLIETIFDTLNAKAAIKAARAAARRPAAVVVADDHRPVRAHAVRPDGRGVLELGQHANPLVVGVNCSLGGKEIRPHIADLARIAGTYTACHPNAGLPNAFGGYDETPQDDRAPPARVRRRGHGQHRRWLLRHDPGAHRRDRRGGRPPRPARRARDTRQARPGSPGLSRSTITAGHRIRDDRRAD